MSNLFTKGERALATLGLSTVQGDALDVVVGGLGLGYTALQVLQEDRVRSLSVVEYLNPVIQWHEQGLLRSGRNFVRIRCRFVQGDFFLRSRRTPKVDSTPTTPDESLMQSCSILIMHRITGSMAPTLISTPPGFNGSLDSPKPQRYLRHVVQRCARCRVPRDA